MAEPTAHPNAPGSDLIPDPPARPWPKPVEYVYVSWTLALIVAPLMVLFWVLSDDPGSPTTVLVIGGFLAGTALLVTGSTELTARRAGISRSQVTAAVRRAFPKRFTI